MVNSLCSYSHVYWNPYRYASRVRCIVNDTSKHVAPKEIVRLKKLIAYWKEQAGKRSDEDELEEIQEERVSKDKADNRLTGWQRGATTECSWSCSSMLIRICDSDKLSNRTFRYDLTVLYTNCIVVAYYIMAAMPVCTKRSVAHIDRRGKVVRANCILEAWCALTAGSRVIRVADIWSSAFSHQVLISFKPWVSGCRLMTKMKWVQIVSRPRYSG